MNQPSYLIFASLLTVGLSLQAADKEKWDVSKTAPDQLPAAASKKGLTYAKDIKPILEASCFRCHGEEQQKGGLRLDSLEAIKEGGKDGKVVVAGKGHQSALVVSAAQIDDETAMPPKFRPRGPGGPPGPGGPGGPGGPNGGRGGFGPPPKPLTAEQVGLLRAWVDQGAK